MRSAVTQWDEIIACEIPHNSMVTTACSVCKLKSPRTYRPMNLTTIRRILYLVQRQRHLVLIPKFAQLKLNYLVKGVSLPRRGILCGKI